MSKKSNQFVTLPQLTKQNLKLTTVLGSSRYTVKNCEEFHIELF